MNHEFNKHKKSDSIKWVIVFLSILLLSVFVIAANTNGFTNSNPYGWFGDEQKTEQETEKEIPENTDVVNEAGVEIHNSSLMKLSAKLASPSAPMTAAETGVTLTATILPATTTDKTVDWSVEFAEPTSSWASGKNASDYVLVTPTSDGALTATVSAKQGFAAQVKIVVTARSNPEATAYCLVDYGQRLSDTATMSYEGTMFATNGTLTNSGIQSIEAMKTGNWQGMLAVYGHNVYTYTPAYNSAYTIATTQENVVVTVRASNSLYNALKSNAFQAQWFV